MKALHEAHKACEICKVCKVLRFLLTRFVRVIYRGYQVDRKLIVMSARV